MAAVAEIVKMAALGALVGMLVGVFAPALFASFAGLAAFYLLLVRAT